MMKNKWIIGLIIVMLLMTTACGGQNQGAQEKEKVVFSLDWFPNTNHTGVYVAQAKGFFDEEGLDVTIIQPGEGTAEQLVASGSAQFGISYQESTTFARAEGMPVVSIAAVIQNNTSGFMSLSEKGIITPADFEGKKYGGWGSPIEIATLEYLMKQVGADINLVEIVTIGDIDFFAASRAGDIDFAWVYEGWSVIEAELNGYDIHYMDLGKEAEVFNYYTPIMITSEKLINENEALVEKWMRAVVKGYQFAIENPQEAAEILLEEVPELDTALVHASQVFLAQEYQKDASYWGYQSLETWERYNQWLYENGFIDTMIDSEAAFTNRFVQ